MATSLHKNGDLVSGAVLAGLGVYVVLESRHWDYLAPDGPGPGFFPTWYGIALVVLSVALMIGVIRNRARQAEGGINWSAVSRALFAWAALTLSIAALKLVGFLVSFALLTFVVVWLMYRRSLAFAAFSGVALATVFYLIFPLTLNVALPVGILGF